MTIFAIKKRTMAMKTGKISRMPQKHFLVTLILMVQIWATAAQDTVPANGCGAAGHQAGARYGVVTLSSNYMREKPDFTAELGNQALMGTPAEILDEDGYWRKIRTPDPYTAWCVDLGLREMSAEELEQYIAAPKVICTARYSTVWSAPGKKGVNGNFRTYGKVAGKGKAAESDRGCIQPAFICDLIAGDLLLYSGKTAKGFREVILLSGKTGYVSAADSEIFSEWAASRNPSADNIILTAMDFMGVPYLWGGTSIKGVDCSGFTRMVWFMNGILLPRNASEQAEAGFPVEMNVNTADFPVGRAAEFADQPAFRDEMLRRTASLQKGDLIFFGTPVVTDDDGKTLSGESISHVGIYLGEGRFIHASRLVRINSLIPGEPDFYDLSGKMIKARRIVGSGEAEGVISISDSPAYFPKD